MPKSAQIEPGTIVEEHLSPDLRRKLNGNENTVNNLQINSDPTKPYIFQLEYGEDLNSGWDCAIGTDGKSYK